MTSPTTFAPLAVTLCLLILGCSRTTVAEEIADTLITPSPADRIHELINQRQLSSAHWGILIETVEGRVLFAHNADRGFTPASTLKIITTAAALDILGPDYTFETKLEAIGTTDDEGTLHGDLVITGSGDPSLGSWHLDEENSREAVLQGWKDSLVDAGIRRIEGKIIGDGRFFTEEYFNTAWPYGFLVYWFGAGTSGLAFEENAWRATIRPGENVGDRPRIDINPDTGFFSVINDATTGEEGSASDANSINHQVEGNTFRFTGNIAVDHEVINRRGAVWDGPRYGPWLLMEMLEDGGIPVTGGALNVLQLESPQAIDEAAERRLLDVYTSPPLSRLSEVVNRVSQNFFADQILRTLGRLERNEGSYRSGIQVVGDWMESIGAPDVENLHMRDGSGLAPQNVVQPRHLTHVLKWAESVEHAPARKALRESMSSAGNSGYLTRRYSNAPGYADIRAKTGYIGFARGITGYTTNADGDRLAFAILCNNYSTTNAVVDEVADAIVVIAANAGTRNYTKQP
ncbi:MAG: D-alanyl-D-alanine carboxypeptidase/D-alanyl-D-alanine-endopeptidase [Candidatus Sumerlaeia bacterium]|nr:D-alanyl-D-alanine carboxypeptidase/D-alanyl-D-alanine-endopeptidase [Candidatus Sumerlaeia bacterium]